MNKDIAENITFEKAIEELEDIIKNLEQGDVPLDNTIELYESCLLYTSPSPRD